MDGVLAAYSCGGSLGLDAERLTEFPLSCGRWRPKNLDRRRSSSRSVCRQASRLSGGQIETRNANGFFRSSPARAEDRLEGALRRARSQRIRGTLGAYTRSKVVFAADIRRRMRELPGRNLPTGTTHSAEPAGYPFKRNGSAHVPAGMSGHAQRLNAMRASSNR